MTNSHFNLNSQNNFPSSVNLHKSVAQGIFITFNSFTHF